MQSVINTNPFAMNFLIFLILLLLTIALVYFLQRIDFRLFLFATDSCGHNFTLLKLLSYFWEQSLTIFSFIFWQPDVDLFSYLYKPFDFSRINSPYFLFDIKTAQKHFNCLN